jgi:hypothetical protein
MRKVVGAGLIVFGGLVVYGALTGRLAAMVAALVKPADLGDSALIGLHKKGGAVAGTGSTPDVPPPSSILGNLNNGGKGLA